MVRPGGDAFRPFQPACALPPSLSPHYVTNRRFNLLFFSVFNSITALSYMLFWMTFFNIVHVFA